ncbi:MAG: hypothetical protein HY720_31305 [Planctomycetes bacterium]|nr:hypothetical protein [Planctomycetota bacterium]
MPGGRPWARIETGPPKGSAAENGIDRDRSSRPVALPAIERTGGVVRAAPAR